MGGMQSRGAVLLLFLLIMASGSREARAVPAAPVVHQLRQPDGFVFTARQWGDEFRSGWESADGYTILFDPELNAWAYAEPDQDGGLAGSRRLVGRDMSPGISKGLRPQTLKGLTRRARPFAVNPAASGRGPGRATVRPHAGELSPRTTRNIPVILINFNDTVPTYTAADFAELLFGSGSWSFSDYYEEVSGGAFTVTPGSAGVQGWYSALNGHDYYGQPSGWGPPDTWPGDLVYEAVSQADAVIDFSEYDADGDCLVDAVAVVHQGTGQDFSAVKEDIWSQSWSLSVTYGYGLSHHGPYSTNDVCPSDPSRFVVIDDYIMMPETLPASMGSGIATIGVFAHEYGHVLGLIDLYDTGRPATSQGVGDWSLMASGSWGKVAQFGDRPSHPDPWSKYALGWVAPERILAGEAGKRLPAVEHSGQAWQFHEGSPSTGGEYFLLENRQKTGFDTALPGAGMLLWHIDESRSGNSSEWYPGCTSCSSHYKVALVQADNLYDLEHNVNRGDGGDPFPGASGNRTVSHLTSPSSRLYNGDPAGFSLAAISDPGAQMTADIILADGVPPATSITAAPPLLSNSADASFSFTAGEAASFECRLDAGSYVTCSSPHALSGLGDGSHTFSVRGIDPTGTLETTPPGYAWTVDTLPPETELLETPPPLTADGGGTFTFMASEAGATFVCSIDSGPWGGCSSPLTVSGLAEGSHSFAVQATDPAGNSDPSPASFGWNVARNVKLSQPGQPDSYHLTPGSALATVPTGTSALLLARQGEISDNLVLDRCSAVIIKGGYAADFSTVVGKTAIIGSVNVRCGKLVIHGLTIRPNPLACSPE